MLDYVDRKPTKARLGWTDAQIVTALTAGKRRDGRELAPIMPWRAYTNFTKEDVNSIVAFTFFLRRAIDLLRDEDRTRWPGGRCATPTSSAPHLGLRFAVGNQDTAVRLSFS